MSQWLDLVIPTLKVCRNDCELSNALNKSNSLDYIISYIKLPLLFTVCTRRTCPFVNCDLTLHPLFYNHKLHLGQKCTIVFLFVFVWVGGVKYTVFLL